MTTLDNLLRGICEYPADTHRRLVYADACEDAGDIDRAMFIRVQCEIAARGEVRCSKTGDVLEWYKFTSRCRCEACKLRRTEYMSSRRHVVWDWSVPGIYRETYKRGFVETVWCETSVWERAGASIVSEYPVTRAELSDKQPSLHIGAAAEEVFYVWRCYPGDYYATEHYSDHITSELFSFLPPESFDGRNACIFRSREAAIDALSTAALTWARSVAELPPLEQHP